MPTYYVWAKIIEALADVGYDPNMLARRPCQSLPDLDMEPAQHTSY